MNSPTNKEKTLRRAEHLIARHGLSPLVLEPLATTSKHHANWQEMVEAICDRRLKDLRGKWDQKFSQLSFAEKLTSRQVLRALAEPLLEMMDGPEGRDWICLAAHLSADPRYHVASRPIASSPSFARFYGLLFHATEEPPRQLVDSRFQLIAATIYQSLAYRVRQEEHDLAGIDRELFFENLLDMLAAMAQAPVSANTKAGL